MTYHQTGVLLSKETLYTDKPILVVNLQPLKFVGGTVNQGRTGKIKGYWDPDISVAVVIVVGVRVADFLYGIIMNARIAVICLKFNCEEDWKNSLEEGWRFQSVDQWVKWITSPYPED